MPNVVIQIDSTAAIFSDPESEEAEFQNLLLNIMGGLPLSSLSNSEKELMVKNGFKGEFLP